MMLEAFNEVDTGLRHDPNSEPNWNIFRTREDEEKSAKDTKCLFSMN
jgi:hypothetical protein